MTTPTATSEAAAGLPDLADLTQLANALFSAVPGQLVPASRPPRPVAVGAPASAPGVPSLGAFNPQPTLTALPATPPFPVSQAAYGNAAAPPSLITPRIAPTQAQSADPHGAQAGIAPLVTRGGPALGVPEAYAAAVPAAAPPPAPADAGLPAAHQPAPGSPYYFIGESSAYQPAAARAPASDLAATPSFAFPGADALPAAPAVAGNGAPSFYFVDAAPAAGTAPAGPRPQAAPAAFERRKLFDVEAIRRDFPILAERVNGRPLIWLDNAATTQKPQAVIDRLAHFYAHENSNIHRAAHELAARATDAYEAARNKVTAFLGASSPEEIVFVRGATEGINLVARSWGVANIQAGDEIVVSHLEHHANIVPWQMLASEKGARLRVIPVDDTGQLRLDEYQKLLNDRTKIVAVTQVSNALGTVVPVRQLIDMAHRVGARVLVDGAQSVSHLRVDVQALDADFFVFSGHKIFGPTGIGVVYGKKALLDDMPPYQGGGNMIADVRFEKTVYHGPPARFEAGTGNIADAVGLGAALDYVERLGLENIAQYEHELLAHGLDGLRRIPGLRLIGCAAERTSVMSFVLDGWKTEEVGKALNQDGIAVRSGHHCAQPILRRFGVEATVRPSLAFYNTHDEVDALIAAVGRLAQRR
ncbi:family 2A encapsulin nanocompartment cargo protein cysteine desulfurase [Solimonas soli]|uniref:family 2A encapsulin nanocompartment cargo protein cysteine desulfurase n=1 Tax=Solimonas soli TaxID=413479 RepID=UPI000485183F|nr:family 2A encapsulin nanocompartment cargo protein cysteine desulfurase [Solimonas soli]